MYKYAKQFYANSVFYVPSILINEQNSSVSAHSYIQLSNKKILEALRIRCITDVR